MKNAIALVLLAATSYAKVNLADVMTGSAIAVNVLQIKDTLRRAKAAGKATKRVAVKAARKMSGR